MTRELEDAALDMSRMTAVVWTQPTACELAAADAHRCVHALLWHARHNAGPFSRMSITVAERLAASLPAQAAMPTVTLSAWDGEWALIRDALAHLHRAAGEHDIMLDSGTFARLDGTLRGFQEAASGPSCG